MDEDELKRRVQAAAQAGWSPEVITRFVTAGNALRARQNAQYAQPAAPEPPKVSGWKRFLIEGGALGAQTLAGIGGIAAAPLTGGASIAGAFGAGAGIDAIKRKMLGEKQSLTGSLFSGALTALPVFGEARTAYKGARLAETGVDAVRGVEAANEATQVAKAAKAAKAVDATTRTAEIVPKMAGGAEDFTVQNAIKTGRGAKEFEVGATPFRGQPGSNILETHPYYETPRAKGFVTDLSTRSSQLNTKLGEVKRAAGYWEGSMEPSFNTVVKGTPSNVRSLAAEMGSKYNQDGVIMFTKDARGVGSRYVFNVKDPQVAADLLTKHGISGAAITGNEVKVLDFTGELKDNIASYAKELRVKPSITPGRVEMLEKGNYEQYLQPQRAGAGGGTRLDLPTENVPGSASRGLDSLTLEPSPPNIDPGNSFDIKKLFQPTNERGIVSGKLDNLGTRMERNVSNPLVNASPYGASREKELIEATNQVAGKSAAAKYKNLPGKMDELNAEIQTKLANVKGTVSKAEFQAQLRQDALENGKYVTEADPRHIAELDAQINRLTKNMPDEMTAQDVFQVKKDASQAINKSYDLLDSGASTNLKDQAKYDIYKQMDGHITNMAPEVKDLTTLQSKLIDASPGLKKASEKTIGIPGTGIKTKLANQFVQGGESVGGDFLHRAASFLSVPAINQLSKQAAIHGLIKNPADAPTTDPAAEAAIDPNAPDTSEFDQLIPADMTDPEQITQQLLGGGGGGFSVDNAFGGGSSGSQYSSQDLFNAAIKAYQAGDSKGSDQYLQLAAFQQSQEAMSAKGSSTKLSAAQQSRHDALQSALGSLDSAGVNLDTAGGAKGVAGELGKLPWVGKFIDPQGASYTNTKIELATQLAKAITGGARPGQDVINKYMHSLPDINDPADYAAAKIQKLKQELLSQAKTFKYTDLLEEDDPSTSLFNSLSARAY